MAEKDEKGIIVCSTHANDTSYEFKVIVYPYRYETVTKAMQHINAEVKKSLKAILHTAYDDKGHAFSLSYATNGYSKLHTGDNLKIRLSDNLHYLFALSKPTLEASQPYAVRHVNDSTEVSRQLFLLSDIVRPTAYGQKRLQILQTFLHEVSKHSIIEKRFEPISYLPLMTNYIDMIQIQITDTNCIPIHLQDFTTIVCLYFQKTKSA